MVKYFCKCSHSSLSDAVCVVACSFRITEVLISLASLSSVCRFFFFLAAKIFTHKVNTSLSGQDICVLRFAVRRVIFSIHSTILGQWGWGIHRVSILFPESLKMNSRLITPLHHKNYHIIMSTFRKWKKIINISIEINEIASRKTVQNINRRKSSFFERMNKIGKPLTTLTKEKQRGPK